VYCACCSKHAYNDNNINENDRKLCFPIVGCDVLRAYKRKRIKPLVRHLGATDNFRGQYLMKYPGCYRCLYSLFFTSISIFFFFIWRTHALLDDASATRDKSFLRSIFIGCEFCTHFRLKERVPACNIIDRYPPYCFVFKLYLRILYDIKYDI
jgi:hypothetical protein